MKDKDTLGYLFVFVSGTGILRLINMYHHKKAAKILFLFTLGILILVFAILESKERRDVVTVPQQQIQGDAAVRGVATAFGTHLKEVSLLAEDPVLKDTIQKAYKPFVTSELLSTWLAHPNTAPGRVTSSPWPDHIDILNITMSDAATYTVTGNVVFMTSNEVVHGGNVGTAPFTMTLVDRGDGWRISSYTEERAPAPEKATTGEAQVKATVGKSAHALGIIIAPLEVVTDSRCPINARCIQAGTLKVKTQLTSESGTVPASAVVFTVGEPLTWNGYTITLTDSDPQKMAPEMVSKTGYAYIYTVKK